MTSAQRLKILNNSGRSVFTAQNIQMLWEESSGLNAKISIKRMVEKRLLFKLSKGYYGLNQNFDIYELANIIISPSYISLHSALFYHGIAFQNSNTVVSTALYNYQKKINDVIFEYHAMKESLFLNLEGVKYKENLAIAVPERAILDTFYFGFLPNLDNLEKVNFSYLKELSKIYPKTVQKKAKQLLK